MSTKSTRAGGVARGLVDIVDVVDMVRGVLHEAKRGRFMEERTGAEFSIPRRLEARALRDRQGEEYLRTKLGPGPALVPMLKMEAKRNGVSWASVKMARYTLGVQSVATPEGQVWLLRRQLPTSDR